MALKEKTIDQAGNTLRVYDIELGSSKPGVAGTPLSTSLTTGIFIGGVQTLTGAGAVNVTTLTTELVTTGANSLTLADGANGQVKIITMKTDGGDGTLTPTTKAGYSTITFNDAKDTVLLVFITGTGWVIVVNNGATVA